MVIQQYFWFSVSTPICSNHRTTSACWNHPTVLHYWVHNHSKLLQYL